jgi:hypothetical protein
MDQSKKLGKTRAGVECFNILIVEVITIDGFVYKNRPVCDYSTHSEVMATAS